MNDTTKPPSGPADAASRPTPPPPTTQPIYPAPPAAAPPAPTTPPVSAPPTGTPVFAPTPPSGAVQVPASGAVQIPASAPVHTAATKPKGRALKWIVRSVVTLVMLGLIAVSAYLVVVSKQWSEQVDELKATSEQLGLEVATERAAKEGALAAAEEVQSQLDTLKARVTDLANEEANVKDREDVLIQLLESMTDCADQRGILLDGYGSQWRSNETGAILSSQQYAAQITEYCVSVQAGIDEFFAEEG